MKEHVLRKPVLNAILKITENFRRKKHAGNRCGLNEY